MYKHYSPIRYRAACGDIVPEINLTDNLKEVTCPNCIESFSIGKMQKHFSDGSTRELTLEEKKETLLFIQNKQGSGVVPYRDEQRERLGYYDGVHPDIIIG